MDLTGLLSKCEGLDHNQRMKLMVHLGREARTNPKVAELIKQLSHGNLYEQLLALQTSYGTRDVTTSFQALRSKSKLCKSRAVNDLVIVGSNAKVLEALKTVPYWLLKLFIKRLRGRSRTDAIDAYLESIAGDKDDIVQAKFREFLPMGSAVLVRKHLPRVLEKLDHLSCNRIVLYHAKVVFTIMRDMLLRGGEMTVKFVEKINNLLSITMPKRYPPTIWDTVLEVANAWPKSERLARLQLHHLVQTRPREVAQLLIDRDENSFHWFQSKILAQLSTAQLVAIVRLQGDTFSLYHFSSLTEEQRTAVYQIVGTKWRNQDGVLNSMIFAALWPEEKVAEARRHLELDFVQAQPVRQIPYIAELPWDEGIALQMTFISSREADVREIALVAQIKAAHRHPEYLGAVINLLVQRPREQEPVRCKCLEALDTLSAENWEQRHLHVLEVVIMNTLDSMDISYGYGGSFHQIMNLLSGMLPYYTQWVSEQIAISIGKCQEVPPNLRMPDKKQMKDVLAVLSEATLPVLTRFRNQQKPDLILKWANALGSGLKYSPKILDMLERILEETASSHMASGILSKFKEFQEERLEDLVPRLLDADRGWIELPFINEYVEKHEMKAYMKPVNRFSAKEVVVETNYAWDKAGKFKAAWRLTPTQQREESEKLLQFIMDKERSTNEWEYCIDKFALLCYLDIEPLVALTNDERIPIRVCAIEGLCRLDGGQGIPALIEALNGKQASTAVQNLRLALSALPRDEQFSILKAAPKTRVTVTKELIRLIAELKDHESYTYLVKMGQKPLHRDALITLLKFLAPHIAHDEAYALFTKAVSNLDATIASSVMLSDPGGEQTVADQVRWRTLVASLLSHPEREARSAGLQKCRRYSSDEEKVFMEPLASLLSSALNDEIENAQRLVMQFYVRSDPKVIVDLFDLFKGDREMLKRLVGYLATVAASRREETYDTVKLVCEFLAKDPLTISLRCKLVFQAILPAKLLDWVKKLLPELHADVLVEAEIMINAFGRSGGGIGGSVVMVEELERVLAMSEDERLRRLGLALLVALMGKEGYTTKRREYLEVYRVDKAVLVAEAANYVILPKLEDQ